MILTKHTLIGYYPFGAPMPGRQFNNGNYRYGFNGKENDNEVKGTGNSVDYGLRVYDPRIGKFLSADPLSYKFPYYSPYHFAGNSPIMNLDLDGAEDISYMFKQNKDGSGYTLIGVTDYRNIDGGKGGSLGHGIQVIMINNKGEIRKEFMPTHNFSNESLSLSGKIGKALEKPASALEKIIPKGDIKNTYVLQGEEGRKKVSGTMHDINDALEFTPLAPAAAINDAIWTATDVAADLEKKNNTTATVRSVGEIAGSLIEEAMDLATKNKFVKLITQQSVDQVKSMANDEAEKVDMKKKAEK